MISISSKQEGSAIVTERKLQNATVTERMDSELGLRRTLRFDNPHGLGVMVLEVDADPTPEQLADLERNLPPKDRSVTDDAVQQELWDQPAKTP